MQRLLTAASIAIIATVLVAVFAGVLDASERRAEYLEAEAAYFDCVGSGLSRAECVQSVDL